MVDWSRGFREMVAWCVGRRRAAIINNPYLCPYCHHDKAVLIHGRLSYHGMEWTGDATMRCQFEDCGSEYRWRV